MLSLRDFFLNFLAPEFTKKCPKKDPAVDTPLVCCNVFVLTTFHRLTEILISTLPPPCERARRDLRERILSLETPCPPLALGQGRVPAKGPGAEAFSAPATNTSKYSSF